MSRVADDGVGGVLSKKVEVGGGGLRAFVRGREIALRLEVASQDSTVQ